MKKWLPKIAGWRSPKRLKRWDNHEVAKYYAPLQKDKGGGKDMANYSEMPESEIPELKGVAGWLRLFVIILSAISPLRSIIQTSATLQIAPDIKAQLGTKWTIYEAFTWSLTAATAVATLYFAYRLIWVQNRSTVRLVIRGL
jgi:hypothetical protein